MSYVLGVFAAEKEKEKQREALRDHFAGLAMQAIAESTLKSTKGNGEIVAKNSYAIADWMLAEREKGND